MEHHPECKIGCHCHPDCEVAIKGEQQLPEIATEYIGDGGWQIQRHHDYY